jgi:hypothetical protein
MLPLLRVEIACLSVSNSDIHEAFLYKKDT